MLTPITFGSGRATLAADQWRLSLDAAADGYHNAQVCDYIADNSGQRTMRFSQQPPVTLTVRAHMTVAPGQLAGTAGFGFWNHPFSPDVRRLPRLPRAAWFFYAAPPSNMALAHGVPGHGWKCAVIDALNPLALLLTPLALPAVVAMRSDRLYRRLYPPIQRALKIDEHALDSALLIEPHVYRLRWGRDRVSFQIDGAPVFETDCSPGGSLGFVAWVDNQYAVVTPRGQVGFGVTPVKTAQSLLLDDLRIERG